jgi:hypothetical protein
MISERFVTEIRGGLTLGAAGLFYVKYYYFIIIINIYRCARRIIRI